MHYSLAHPAYTPYMPPGSHIRRNKPNMQIAVAIKNGMAIPDNFANFEKVMVDDSKLKASAFNESMVALEKQLADEAILALELFIGDFAHTKAGRGPWLAPDGSKLEKAAGHESMRRAAKRKFDGLNVSERARYMDAAQEMAAFDEDHDLSDNIAVVMQKSTPSWYKVKECMIHDSIRQQWDTDDAKRTEDDKDNQRI